MASERVIAERRCSAIARLSACKNRLKEVYGVEVSEQRVNSDPVIGQVQQLENVADLLEAVIAATCPPVPTIDAPKPIAERDAVGEAQAREEAEKANASPLGAPTQTVAEEQGAQSEVVAEPAPELHAELQDMAETATEAAETVAAEVKADTAKAALKRGRKAKA